MDTSDAVDDYFNDIKFKTTKQHSDNIVSLFKNLNLIETSQSKDKAKVLAAQEETSGEINSSISTEQDFNNSSRLAQLLLTDNKNITTFRTGLKKSLLKDPQSGKSSLKVRWKDSIEISNILDEDKDDEDENKNNSDDQDENVNNVYDDNLDDVTQGEKLLMDDDDDDDEDDEDHEDEDDNDEDEVNYKVKMNNQNVVNRVKQGDNEEEDDNDNGNYENDKDDEDDDSIDSSELETKTELSNSKIIIDKKLNKEAEKTSSIGQVTNCKLEYFNLKPLHSIGIEFENEMLARLQKLENISNKLFNSDEKCESEKFFNEIFSDLDLVLFELHSTIEHVRLSSMITSSKQFNEEDISNEVFKKNLEENLNQIALICREFVQNSKTMISSALVDDKVVRPHVRTSMNSLSLLVKTCFEICFKFMYKNEKLDEIRQLLIQILNLLNTFRNTLNITFLAATKQLNDAQMSLLMKQAHSLANEISLLIKHFKLIF